MMQKLVCLFRSILLFSFVFFSMEGFAQVTLTRTSGTATGMFTTLRGGFDADNARTHKGVIVININASTTETASKLLTVSAGTSASASYYTSVNIYPNTTGLSISGALAALLFNLNGGGNVINDVGYMLRVVLRV